MYADILRDEPQGPDGQTLTRLVRRMYRETCNTTSQSETAPRFSDIE